MNKTRKIAVIFNVTSGIGDPIRRLRKIRENFRLYNLDPAFFFVGDSGKEIRREVRIALEERFDTIVAAGGDGTIGSVASELIGKPATLAIIPNGTFNFFSKFIGTPNIEEAIKTIALGKTEAMDIGSVNGHTFLNNSTLGLHADLVHTREKLERLGWQKWIAYPIALYRRIKKFRPRERCFAVQDKNFCQKTPLIFVGNNEYPFKANNPETKKQFLDSQLGLYIIQPTTLGSITKTLGKFLLGMITRGKDYAYFRSNSLIIDTKNKKEVVVSVDGETLKLTSPLHYQIKPKALRVMFP